MNLIRFIVGYTVRDLTDYLIDPYSTWDQIEALSIPKHQVIELSELTVKALYQSLNKEHIITHEKQLCKKYNNHIK